MGRPVATMQTLPGQADMSAAEDRERRKISMQKCNITYGFEPVDYDTSSENLGKIKTACVIRDNTAMAESMRQSSIWSAVAFKQCSTTDFSNTGGKTRTISKR